MCLIVCLAPLRSMSLRVEGMKLMLAPASVPSGGGGGSKRGYAIGRRQYQIRSTVHAKIIRYDGNGDLIRLLMRCVPFFWSNPTCSTPNAHPQSSPDQTVRMVLPPAVLRQVCVSPPVGPSFCLNIPILSSPHLPSRYSKPHTECCQGKTLILSRSTIVAPEHPPCLLKRP